MASEVGMHLHFTVCEAGKSHLWERIFIRRDEISGDESSLEDIFNPQG